MSIRAMSVGCVATAAMVLAMVVSSCNQSPYDGEPSYCECQENGVSVATCETVQICWDVDDLDAMGADGWDEGPGLMQDTVSSCCGDYDLLSMSAQSIGAENDDGYETCSASFEVAQGEISVFCHNNPESAS